MVVFKALTFNRVKLTEPSTCKEADIFYSHENFGICCCAELSNIQHDDCMTHFVKYVILFAKTGIRRKADDHPRSANS